MQLGRTLRTYKAYFKAARGWTAAMTVIADAIGHDEKTVERIIGDYERVAPSPTIVARCCISEKFCMKHVGRSTTQLGAC